MRGKRRPGAALVERQKWCPDQDYAKRFDGTQAPLQSKDRRSLEYRRDSGRRLHLQRGVDGDDPASGRMVDCQAASMPA